MVGCGGGRALGRARDSARATGCWPGAGTGVDRARHGQAEEGAERAGHRGPGRPVRGECAAAPSRLAAPSPPRGCCAPASVESAGGLGARRGSGVRVTPEPRPQLRRRLLLAGRKGKQDFQDFVESSSAPAPSPSSPELRTPALPPLPTSGTRAQTLCTGQSAPVYFFVLHPSAFRVPSPHKGRAELEQNLETSAKGRADIPVRRPHPCRPGKGL